MKNILTVTIGLIFSLSSYAQYIDAADTTKSGQEKTLLLNFWTEFKMAISKKDKDDLAALCEFPFYCSPCIDDTILKTNDSITVKVTKKLFYKNQYKDFFRKPITDLFEQYQKFNPHIFYPTYNVKHKRDGFTFSYTIVAPSKTWEGLQGFIFIAKKGEKFKIAGIDTVP